MTDQLAADGLDDETDAEAGPPELHDDDEPVGSNPSPPANAGDPTPVRAGTNWLGRPKRISRWDRPPDPHDWRFYVGTLGRILIVTGLLLFGFVAYQLWGTGIETARAQNRLENEFAELVAATTDAASDRPVLVAEVPADLAPVADPADPTDAADAADAADEEIEAVDDAADDGGGMDPLPEITADDITPPVAVSLVEEAVVQENLPQPFRGDPLLRLEIPEIGRDDIVVPGVTLNDLKQGPGHYPDSPLPGQLGNASIAGHRTTYGAPFFDVDQLAAGDEIITTLLNGDRFVYEVTFVEVVSASDYHVVTTSDPTIAELTLTSCDPKYTARDRIVVHSVLNPDKSSNVGFPTFYTLEPGPEAAPDPIPGDDPTVVADPADVADDRATDPVGAGDTGTGSDDTDRADDGEAGQAPGEPDDGGAADGEPRSEVAAPVDASDQPTATGGSAAETADRDAVDAFSEGWFDDRGAFPQIALWAAVLILISLVAYRIAARFRNLAVGVLVGVAPFVVALYFFYQNVNRLLPPGI